MVKNSNIKTFNVRISRDVWKFLKKVAVDQERSMNDVIIECVEKYLKRLENKLQDRDAMV